MKKLTAILWGIMMAMILPIAACSNSDFDEAEATAFNIQFELPSLLEVNQDGTCHLTWSGPEAPLTTDVFVTETPGGVSYVYPIASVSPSDFTVQLSAQFQSGSYKVALKRGNRKKYYGSTYIQVIDELPITPEAGTTVYGRVTAAGEPVAQVVVSDGVETTTTNADGIYQLKSAKQLGYVFLSVPGGYEAPTQGVLPRFFQSTKAAASTAERMDFTLQKVDGQDHYVLYVLGDMHLANRNGDRAQFLRFTDDLNAQRNRHTGKRQYAVTLGDMSWDLYWYSNNFGLPEYLFTLNEQLRDLPVFHTLGNHDYDFKAHSDLEASRIYRSQIAPAYYSFNLGQVHYVVLDDIDCDAYDGTTARNYQKRLSATQLSWLAKDLSYVAPETPVVLVMHAQVFYPSQIAEWKIDHDLTGTTQLLKLLDGRRTHILTGHTHLNYNVTPQHHITGGRDLYEHNTAAVCGSWWWSGHLTPGVHLSPDGTPGGYAIWEVDGQDLAWSYKGTGKETDYQFRTYDLNQVSFSLADVPQMSTHAAVRKAYQKYTDAYPANQDNEVLINIWNWSPEWTLTVTTETGETLQAEPVWAYDPLHIAAMTVKRFNDSKLTTAPNFCTELFPHFFKVKAPDADTDLTIRVQDPFQRTYTEKMVRPQAFKVAP